MIIVFLHTSCNRGTVMTEDISETIRIMKKFNMDDKQRRRFNRLRENYGLLPIKKR